MRCNHLLAVVLALCLAPVYSNADELFNNPLNSSEFGWNSNVNGGLQQAADDFTLVVDSTVDSVTWYGFDQSGLLGNNFQVRIFEFNAGTGEPGLSPFYDESVGFVNGTDTLIDSFGNDILEYTVSLPDVDLLGGVEYWLMIGSTDGTTWTWSHSDTVAFPDDQFHRDGDGDAWRSLRDLGFPDSRLDQAFQLSGTPVPEPSGLLLLSLVSAAWVSRRRPRN